MKYQKWITFLVLTIAVFALLATATGIFSADGAGPYPYENVRGETVMIYGKVIYQHMSAEVAPQGIGQDVVTMLLGIPLLLIALFLARKGSLRGKILLAGILGYFLVTYLFYLVMAMYNQLFLVYIILLQKSFFAFVLTMLELNSQNMIAQFAKNTPVKFVGGFLIFNALCIAFLWLSVVVPPFLAGTIPIEVEHYTTLIVQGLDLSVLLPLAFLSGVLLIKRRPFGYLMAPVYIVFLALLMSALTAKIVAMALVETSVGPPIVIIPLFAIAAISCTTLILKNVDDTKKMGINIENLYK